MKKVIKIVIAIALIITFIVIPQLSFASSYDDIQNWDIGMTEDVPDTIIDIVGLIIGLLRNLTILLTVLIITGLGIKYMISSVEEKAVSKKAFGNIIMGAVLVSIITTIVSVIFSAFEN